MNKLYEEADGLLARIADSTLKLQGWEAELAAKIEELKAAYAQPAEYHRAELDVTKAALVELMKANRNEFFSDEVDRVDLAHGALLHKVIERVRRSKKITPEILEGLGYAEAVKIAKSVDWDAVEKWPDVRLAQIGTERKQTEKFEYELK